MNLGVVNADPSSTAGTITILEYLQQYCPNSPSGQPYQLVCHVDGGAYERMQDARKARAGRGTPRGRLEGLLPNAQEFHKRALKLQVGICMRPLVKNCTHVCSNYWNYGQRIWLWPGHLKNLLFLGRIAWINSSIKGALIPRDHCTI